MAQAVRGGQAFPGPLYDRHSVDPLDGISRVAFMFELERFGLLPMGQDPEEVTEDLVNA